LLPYEYNVHEKVKSEILVIEGLINRLFYDFAQSQGFADQ
jgi:hypothetical protein